MRCGLNYGDIFVAADSSPRLRVCSRPAAIASLTLFGSSIILFVVNYGYVVQISSAEIQDEGPTEVVKDRSVVSSYKRRLMQASPRTMTKEAAVPCQTNTSSLGAWNVVSKQACNDALMLTASNANMPHLDLMGVYTKLRIQPAPESDTWPVYAGPKGYLYWWKPFKNWRIGEHYSASHAWISSHAVHEQCPESVPQTKWAVWEERDGIFQWHNEDISVKSAQVAIVPIIGTDMSFDECASKSMYQSNPQPDTTSVPGWTCGSVDGTGYNSDDKPRPVCFGTSPPVWAYSGGSINGDGFLGLQMDGCYIEQTFTGVPPHADLTITFKTASRQGYPQPTLEVIVDGLRVYTESVSNSILALKTATCTSDSSGLLTLRFTSGGASTGTNMLLFLDDVSITIQAPTVSTTSVHHVGQATTTSVNQVGQTTTSSVQQMGTSTTVTTLPEEHNVINYKDFLKVVQPTTTTTLQVFEVGDQVTSLVTEGTVVKVDHSRKSGTVDVRFGAGVEQWLWPYQLKRRSKHQAEPAPAPQAIQCPRAADRVFPILISPMTRNATRLANMRVRMQSWVQQQVRKNKDCSGCVVFVTRQQRHHTRQLAARSQLTFEVHVQYNNSNSSRLYHAVSTVMTGMNHKKLAGYLKVPQLLVGPEYRSNRTYGANAMFGKLAYLEGRVELLRDRLKESVQLTEDCAAKLNQCNNTLDLTLAELNASETSLSRSTQENNKTLERCMLKQDDVKKALERCQQASDLHSDDFKKALERCKQGRDRCKQDALNQTLMMQNWTMNQKLMLQNLTVQIEKSKESEQNCSEKLLDMQRFSSQDAQKQRAENMGLQAKLQEQIKETVAAQTQDAKLTRKVKDAQASKSAAKKKARGYQAKYRSAKTKIKELQKKLAMQKEAADLYKQQGQVVAHQQHGAQHLGQIAAPVSAITSVGAAGALASLTVTASQVAAYGSQSSKKLYTLFVMTYIQWPLSKLSTLDNSTKSLQYYNESLRQIFTDRQLELYHNICKDWRTDRVFFILQFVAFVTYVSNYLVVIFTFLLVTIQLLASLTFAQGRSQSQEDVREAKHIQENDENELEKIAQKHGVPWMEVVGIHEIPLQTSDSIRKSLSERIVARKAEKRLPTCQRILGAYCPPLCGFCLFLCLWWGLLIVTENAQIHRVLHQGHGFAERVYNQPCPTEFFLNESVLEINASWPEGRRVVEFITKYYHYANKSHEKEGLYFDVFKRTVPSISYLCNSGWAGQYFNDNFAWATHYFPFLFEKDIGAVPTDCPGGAWLGFTFSAGFTVTWTASLNISQQGDYFFRMESEYHSCAILVVNNQTIGTTGEWPDCTTNAGSKNGLGYQSNSSNSYYFPSGYHAVAVVYFARKSLQIGADPGRMLLKYKGPDTNDRMVLMGHTVLTQKRAFLTEKSLDAYTRMVRHKYINVWKESVTQSIGFGLRFLNAIMSLVNETIITKAAGKLSDLIEVERFAKAANFMYSNDFVENGVLDDDANSTFVKLEEEAHKTCLQTSACKIASRDLSRKIGKLRAALIISLEHQRRKHVSYSLWNERLMYFQKQAGKLHKHQQDESWQYRLFNFTNERYLEQGVAQVEGSRLDFSDKDMGNTPRKGQLLDLKSGSPFTFSVEGRTYTGKLVNNSQQIKLTTGGQGVSIQTSISNLSAEIGEITWKVKKILTILSVQEASRNHSYTFKAGRCMMRNHMLIAYPNIQTYHECKKLCDRNRTCKAFEINFPHGKNQRNNLSHGHRIHPFACLLFNSNASKQCVNHMEWEFKLYVKEAERRTDPMLSGRSVTFAEMSTSLSYLGLSYTQLRSHWQSIQKTKVGACPSQYPICYKTGACVIASCGDGCSTWSMAPTAQAHPGNKHNWLLGSDGGGMPCTGNYIQAASGATPTIIHKGNTTTARSAGTTAAAVSTTTEREAVRRMAAAVTTTKQQITKGERVGHAFTTTAAAGKSKAAAAMGQTTMTAKTIKTTVAATLAATTVQVRAVTTTSINMVEDDLKAVITPEEMMTNLFKDNILLSLLLIGGVLVICVVCCGQCLSGSCVCYSIISCTLACLFYGLWQLIHAWRHEIVGFARFATKSRNEAEFIAWVLFLGCLVLCLRCLYFRWTRKGLGSNAVDNAVQADTKLIKEANAQDTIICVESTLDWRVGDNLKIGSETVRIQSIMKIRANETNGADNNNNNNNNNNANNRTAGSQIHLEKGLQSSHNRGSDVYEMRQGVEVSSVENCIRDVCQWDALRQSSWRIALAFVSFMGVRISERSDFRDHDTIRQDLLALAIGVLVGCAMFCVEVPTFAGGNDEGTAHEKWYHSNGRFFMKRMLSGGQAILKWYAMLFSAVKFGAASQLADFTGSPAWSDLTTLAKECDPSAGGLLLLMLVTVAQHAVEAQDTMDDISIQSREAEQVGSKDQQQQREEFHKALGKARQAKLGVLLASLVPMAGTFFWLSLTASSTDITRPCIEEKFVSLRRNCTCYLHHSQYHRCNCPGHVHLGPDIRIGSFRQSDYDSDSTRSSPCHCVQRPREHAINSCTCSQDRKKVTSEASKGVLTCPQASRRHTAWNCTLNVTKQKTEKPSSCLQFKTQEWLNPGRRKLTVLASISFLLIVGAILHQKMEGLAWNVSDPQTVKSNNFPLPWYTKFCAQCFVVVAENRFWTSWLLLAVEMIAIPWMFVRIQYDGSWPFSYSCASILMALYLLSPAVLRLRYPDSNGNSNPVAYVPWTRLLVVLALHTLIALECALTNARPEDMAVAANASALCSSVFVALGFVFAVMGSRWRPLFYLCWKACEYEQAWLKCRSRLRHDSRNWKLAPVDAERANAERANVPGFAWLLVHLWSWIDETSAFLGTSAYFLHLKPRAAYEKNEGGAKAWHCWKDQEPHKLEFSQDIVKSAEGMIVDRMHGVSFQLRTTIREYLESACADQAQRDEKRNKVAKELDKIGAGQQVEKAGTTCSFVIYPLGVMAKSCVIRYKWYVRFVKLAQFMFEPVMVELTNNGTSYNLVEEQMPCSHCDGTGSNFTKAVDSLKLSGPLGMQYHADKMGIYRKYKETPDQRAIYLGPQRRFLYYWPDCMDWRVGDNPNAAEAYITSMRGEEAQNPKDVKQWFVWNHGWIQESITVTQILQAMQVNFKAKFKPGHIGFYFRAASGEVTKVFDDSQAQRRGVRPGMSMVEIDGQKYKPELFYNKKAGKDEFEINFSQAAKPVFMIDELVERRDGEGPWGQGKVTSVVPLRVTFDENNPMGYAWDDVRKLDSKVLTSFKISGASGDAAAANGEWYITGTHDDKPKYENEQKGRMMYNNKNNKWTLNCGDHSWCNDGERGSATPPKNGWMYVNREPSSTTPPDNGSTSTSNNASGEITLNFEAAAATACKHCEGKGTVPYRQPKESWSCLDDVYCRGCIKLVLIAISIIFITSHIPTQATLLRATATNGTTHLRVRNGFGFFHCNNRFVPLSASHMVACGIVVIDDGQQQEEHDIIDVGAIEITLAQPLRHSYKVGTIIRQVLPFVGIVRQPPVLGDAAPVIALLCFIIYCLCDSIWRPAVSGAYFGRLPGWLRGSLEKFRNGGAAKFTDEPVGYCPDLCDAEGYALLDTTDPDEIPVQEQTLDKSEEATLSQVSREASSRGNVASARDLRMVTPECTPGAGTPVQRPHAV